MSCLKSNNRRVCNVAYAKCALILWKTCWIMFPLMLYCRLQTQQHRAASEPSSRDIVSGRDMTSSLTPWAQTRTPPSSDGGVSKKVATSSDKFLMKGMQLLTKLCLKNAMDVRELQVATLLTIQMPKDSDFIAHVITATRSYNDEQLKAKSSGGQAPVGQPHCHAWIAMLETLLQQNSVTTAEREAVQKHIQDYCGSQAMVVATVVHVCRVKKCFDQSKMKVCIAVSDDVRPVMSILQKRLHEKGGKTLHGQAPKGASSETSDASPRLASNDLLTKWADRQIAQLYNGAFGSYSWRNACAQGLLPGGSFKELYEKYLPNLPTADRLAESSSGIACTSLTLRRAPRDGHPEDRCHELGELAAWLHELPVDRVRVREVLAAQLRWYRMVPRSSKPPQSM
ncbi:unnamed protein product [Symbiodinium sp. CCMP2592]|nr:unnamed protein product [Symbiodinium sp. CCMP2592]